MHGAGMDDRTLRRIIALLVSLAAIAERAAGRSFPVRWLVLAILRSGEPVARAFVLEATQMDWPCLEDDPVPGNGPDDATLLGLRFRVLAAILGAVLPQAGLLDIDVSRAPRSVAEVVIAPRFDRIRPNDTS